MARAPFLSLVFFVSGCFPDPVMRCEEALHDQILVFSAWHHEEVAGDGRREPRGAVGFDLDGVVSDGAGPNCTDEEDFVSPIRGEAGVDNQYAANLLFLLEGTPVLADGVEAHVLEQMLRGERVFGLEVFVGPDHAPLVGLVELDPVAPMSADASGRALAPDQHFRILARQPVSARCEDGVLELEWARFDLPMGDPIGAVPLHDVHLALEVGPTGDLGGGELGARYPFSFVAEVAEAVEVFGFDETTLRSLAQPDLDASVDGRFCDSVSFGVGVDVVPATIVR